MAWKKSAFSNTSKKNPGQQIILLDGVFIAGEKDYALLRIISGISENSWVDSSLNSINAFDDDPVSTGM